MGMTEVLEKIGAGEGNRTLVFSLEGCCSTIELPPRLLRMIFSENRCPTLPDHCGIDLTRPDERLNYPRPQGAISLVPQDGPLSGLNLRRFAAYIERPINNERR